MAANPETPDSRVNGSYNTSHYKSPAEPNNNSVIKGREVPDSVRCADVNDMNNAVKSVTLPKGAEAGQRLSAINRYPSVENNPSKPRSDSTKHEATHAKAMTCSGDGLTSLLMSQHSTPSGVSNGHPSPRRPCEAGTDAKETESVERDKDPDAKESKRDLYIGNL